MARGRAADLKLAGMGPASRLAARAYAALVPLLASALHVLRVLASLSAARAAASAVEALLPLAARRVPLAGYAAASLSWGHTSCVKSVAVLGEHVYTGCWDFLVKQWDARTGACVLTFVGHRQDVIGIAAHRARRISRLFSCGDFCRLWDTQSGAELARFGAGTYYCAAANGTHVFAARANGAIEMFRHAHVDGAAAAAGPVPVPERTLVGHLAGVMDMSLRGGLLLSASIDLTARAWCVESGTPLLTFAGHTEALRCCCLWRGSLFTGSLDKTIRQWSLASGECVRTLEGHNGAVRALVTVGNFLFSASSDNSIAQWDLARAHEPAPPFAGAGAASLAAADAAAASGGDPHAGDASGGYGNGSGLPLIRLLTGHTDGVFALCERDGRLYSGSADRTAKRWCLRGYGGDASCGYGAVAVTQEYRSRRPFEIPAVLAERLLGAPLRELLPPLARLAPLAALAALWRDVEAAADAQPFGLQHVDSDID